MGRPVITREQMILLEQRGVAKIMSYTGIQKRPVYLVNGVAYERAIHFEGDGDDHSDFYQCSPERAAQLKQEALHSGQN